MTKKLKLTPNSTVPSVFNDRINLTPDVVALIDGDTRLTFKELGEQVHHTAAALQDLGIQKGEKVGLIFENGIQFPVVLFAVYQIGAVPLSVNPTLKPKEIQHILNDSETVALIIGDHFDEYDPIDTIESIREDLPLIRHLIIDGTEPHSGVQLSHLLEKTLPRRVDVDINPDDLAILIYTSGTTGLPKGGMHTHKSQLVPIGRDSFQKPTIREMVLMVQRYGFEYILRFLKIIGKTMVFFSTGPPYTAAGTFGAVMTILTGKTYLIKDRFSPIEVVRLIEKERVNVLFAVPSLLALICRNQIIKNHDISSLLFIFSGAAYVSPSLTDEVRKKLGCPIMIGYGGTEFGTPTMTNPFSDSDKALRETVGKVGDTYELRIVNDDRQTLPTGEVGEIAVRGPSLMRGYYKDEAATRDVFDEEGWVYTGDLGNLDEDGYLRITGRIKDMIIRAGQNIYPVELEDVLVKHPKIYQAAVVGVPDDLSGEKVVAFIIPKDGTDLDKVQVLNFCRKNMAPYKIPANVYFVDEFPLNATGKVLKRALRKKAMP